VCDKIELLVQLGAPVDAPLWGGELDGLENDFEEFNGFSELWGYPKFITPMYVAVEKENWDVVRALVWFGSDLRRKLSKTIASPLCFALHTASPLATGRLEGVKTLLGCGCDPNATDDFNMERPLKFADTAEASELLICQGAEVNARCSVNWTNLHFNFGRGNVELAKMLVANGANPRAVDSDEMKTPQHCLVGFVDVHSVAFFGRAERAITRLNKRNQGLPYQTTGAVSEAELDALQAELQPYVITEQRISTISAVLFQHSAQRAVQCRTEQQVLAAYKALPAVAHWWLPRTIFGFLVTEDGRLDEFDAREDCFEFNDDLVDESWDLEDDAATDSDADEASFKDVDLKLEVAGTVVLTKVAAHFIDTTLANMAKLLS
jgi:hypothetical protein